MIAVVVLAVLLLAWLIVSAITAVACTAVVRGGVQEDRARGFLDDRS
jgi:hypothetical protein